ncbi:MAG: hypothetical protein IAE78_17605 [Myxococcus sp.]|nr:hypothetical protein [Myxococcus sp.]
MPPPKDPRQGQSGAPAKAPEAAPRRPTGQMPLPTAKSQAQLPQVPGGKSPTGQIPVAGGRSSSNLPPVSTSKAQLPQVTSKSSAQLPQVGAKPTRTTTGSIPVQTDPGTTGPTSFPPGGFEISKVNRAHMTEVQKLQQDDAFGSWGPQRKRANFIGTATNPGTMKAVAEEEEWIDPDYNPDGSSPLPECVGRETWRALKAPFTSREGKRSKALYQQVFNQFALGNNDRYDEDGPGKPRGHIYVWDVSRAMGCEVPHFAGARELSLVQTIDWLKHEGPMRGWVRVNEADVVDIAERGMLVVAIPKEMRVRHMAIVTPQEPGGRPLLTGAGLVVGVNVECHELFGVTAIDYYYHP